MVRRKEKRLITKVNKTGSKDCKDTEDTAIDLKEIQRVYQITPSNDSLKVLLKQGLESAQDIVAIPYSTFIERFGDAFDKKDKVASRNIARRAYLKAQQVITAKKNGIK